MTKADDTLFLLNKTLKANFKDFHQLYLFGLFADGKEHDGEDIEIVAIFDKEDKQKREVIWRIVGKIEETLDVYIDLHPLTMIELQADEELYDEVINNGKLYKG